MKAVLPEYYDYSTDELRTFLQRGTIALDANVLLALYRVGKDQRNQILEVLTKVADRVFVPYQAALEYQRNRLKVVSSQLNAHQEVASIAANKATKALCDATDALRTMSEDAQKAIRDPDIKKSVRAEFEQTISDLEKLTSKAKDRMTSRLEKLKAEHTIPFEIARESDPVRQALDSILVGDRVGATTGHSSRKADAQKRLDSGLPPGGKDKDKEDPTGDGIIWLELIEHTKSAGRQLLFVTDDQKQDWYRTTRNQKLGPLVELKVEMTASTGQPYHQTTLDGFLRLANSHLGARVSEDTIESIRTRRKEDVIQRTVRWRLLDVHARIDVRGAIRPIALISRLAPGTHDPIGRPRKVPLTSFSDLERSGALIGDTVLVRHSDRGQWLRPLEELRDGTESEVPSPHTCPGCSAGLARIESGAQDSWELVCFNPECGASTLGSLRSLDIERDGAEFGPDAGRDLQP